MDSTENFSSDKSILNDSEVLDFIKKHPFSNSPFDLEGGKKYSEAKFRELARYISSRIKHHLFVNDGDPYILNLIREKLSPEEIADYIENKGQKDLLDAKTLRRCFEENKYSNTTLNIFRAFIRVVNDEKTRAKNIARIAGTYYIFNSHNTTSNTFQSSILKINNNAQGTLKYLNRSLEPKTKRVKIEIIGTTKIQISLREKTKISNYYGYIAADAVKPLFIQTVYFYSNRSDKTIANIAIFARVQNDTLGSDKYFDSFKPYREKKFLTLEGEEYLNQKIEGASNVTVLQNIQYYLLNVAKPIEPTTFTNTKLFDFTRRVPRYPASNYRVAKNYPEQSEFIGDYFIYFNERFPSLKISNKYLKQNDFYSSVGRGVLSIFKDQSSGILRCRMKTLKNAENEELLHSGYIINHTLDNEGYLIIALYQHSGNDKRTRYLNLHLSVENGKKFVGTFSISYASEKRSLSCGTIVIINQKSVAKSYGHEEISTTPSSFLSSATSSKSELEQNILNFVSRNNQAIISIPDFDKIKSYGNSQYEGLYKMYNYNSTSKSLRMSFLKIFKNDLVIHLAPKNEIAYGQTEKNNNTLNIILKNRDTGRTGFCCIKVGRDSKNKSDIDRDTIFLGTFSGVSRSQNEYPVASKFILEFIGKESTLEEHEDNLGFIEADSPLMKKNKFLIAVYKYLSKGDNKGSSLYLDFDAFTKDKLMEKINGK